MSITLRSDSGLAAGAITEAGLGLTASTDPSGNSVVVTAVADSNSALKLISWKVPPAGNSVSRMSDSGTQAGQSSLVDMAASTQNRVITGVRTSDGNLRLIAWQVQPADGSIHRLTDSGNHIGAVSLVAMSPSPEGNGNVLVALKNSSGNLMVENWGFDGSGALARHGDVTAGGIGGVAVGPMSGGRAWTAVIDSNGDLKVIVWRVGAGGSLTRAGDSGTHAGTAKQVSGVAMGDFLVTALRDGGNNLLLISWKISADGNTVTRIADTTHQAGGADTISCCVLPVNDPGRVGKVITALRARELTLELIAWNVSSSGAIQRAESFSDRPGTFDMGKIVAGAPGIFVTAIRESQDQRLKLVVWQILDGNAVAVLPNNLVLYGSSTWENTAQAIAPTSALPKGTLVMQIGEPRDAAGFVWRDLLDGSSAVSLNAPPTRVGYPLTATQANATDNQLLLLQDGSLLGIKNGYVWSDLPHPPAWFNTCTVSGQSSKQARNCILVFRSTDSGRTWSQISLIDAAVAAGGDFGWPQGDGTAAGNGSKGVGGFDRCEAYQDPFTGHIYISGGGDGGPYVRSSGTVSNHAGVVFVSTDNGVTWSEQARFANQGKGGAPYAMTSTPNHPLIVFNLFGGPTLYHLAKNAKSISAGQSVVLKVNGSTVNAAGDSGIDDLRGVPPSIARVGANGSHDQVWIAYPALNANSRQMYQICLVTFDDSGQAPSVEEVTTIQAEDPVNRAVAMGTFVQDSFPNPGSANPANVTMFYWIDAPEKTAADPNHLTARYKLLCNRFGQFQAGALSVSGGAERSFGRLGIGDYFKGGVFAWNGKLNFLAQWREPDADRANIVSV